MSDQPHKISRAEAYEHWTARHAKSILFVILTMVGAGVYFAYNLPVSVFPSTDFPRIVIGADNGVMPIEQMTVIVTRQLEEAVNGIQGINRVQSITSRGSAEINLFFDWDTDMNPGAGPRKRRVARIQPNLPQYAQAERAASDLRCISGHGIQRDVGHHAADQAVGTGHL